MDKHQSLVQQLDEHRPEKPSCADTAVKDRMDEYLLADTVVQGVPNIILLLKEKIAYSLEHPESYSFGDLAKISAPKKSVTEVGTGNGLLNIFARFEEEPMEVIDAVKEGEE